MASIGRSRAQQVGDGPRLAVGATHGRESNARRESNMSKQTKPSIVFAHGIWADGSSFSKVIRPLQEEGYEVASAQYGLDTFKGDVATTLRTLGRVSSPAILVGHSYGGSVITAAGTD